MVLSLDELAAMIRDIPCVTLDVDEGTWSVEADFSEQPKIALKQIRLVQKQLRGVKKAVNGTMKMIRAEYRTKISGATYHPGFAGGFMGPKYRRVRRAEASSQKDQLRVERDAMLQGYESLKMLMDQVIYQLDSKKLDLET